MNMKKFLLFLMLCLLVFGLNSCKDNLFDFDLKNVEADGEWGIPVVNDKITLETLLNNMDSLTFLRVGSDGTISIVMEKDMPNLVTMNRLLQMGGKSFSTTGQVPLATGSAAAHIEELITFNLNNDKAVLKRAAVEEGSIILTFDFTDLPASYHGTIYSNNITDESGSPLTINVNSNNTTYTVDLSDYVIQVNADGNIVFSSNLTLTATPGTTVGGVYHYTCGVVIGELELQSIVALLNSISSTIEKNDTIDFSLRDFNVENMIVYNPRIQISAKNNLTSINGRINVLTFLDGNGIPSPIITSPVDMQIPVSPYNYVQVADETMPCAQFSSYYKYLQMAGDVLVNPEGFSAGEVYLNKNSSLGFKVKATYPANVCIDNAVYHKEMDNGLYGKVSASDIPSIERLTLRLAFTNDLPFDMNAEIAFLNTTTHDTMYVNLSENTIHGSYNGVPYNQTPIYVEFDNQRAKRIVESDKILVRLRANTQGNDVVLTTSQYIKVAIGAKLKYDNINLANNK